MIYDRKLRACFISAIVLFSSLSVLIVIPENVKADSGDKTLLYFHEEGINKKIPDESIVEEIILNDLYKLVEELNITDEELLNLTNPKTLNTYISHPKLIWMLSLLYGSLIGVSEEETGESFVKILDSKHPTKTNDSEHPKINIEKIIETLSNIETSSIEDASDLFEMISSLAPLPAVYVYNGDETLTLDGDIEFSLFFDRSLSYLWNNDIVNVNFYIYDPEEFFINYTDKYNDTTQTIDINRQEFGKILEDPARYNISFEVNDIQLNPRDIIYIEIERKAGDKPFLESAKDKNDFDLTEIAETLRTWGEDLSNSPIPSISEIGEQLINLSEIIQDTSELLNESDIIDLLYNLIVEVISSSFIYDSIQHPSYISLPCSIPEELDSNTRIYYLSREDNKDTLKKDKPLGDETSSIDLSKEGAGEWNGSEIGMSKVLKGASMGLYLNYRDLIKLVNILRGKIKVCANIYAGEDVVAYSEKELDRTTIFDLLEPENDPIMFNFTVVTDKEISYDTSLSLEVYISNDTKWGLGVYRNVKLLYDSQDCPSFLLVEFDETDNIKMNVTGPEEIAAGDSAHFILNITSEYDDNVRLSNVKTSAAGEWSISHPDSVDVSSEGYTLVDVYVNSKAEDISAYDNDYITLIFEATGTTGKATQDATVTVSSDKVVYDIDFVAPPGKIIKRGKDGTYHIIFVNNNTGFWPDDYTIEAFSSHKWDLNVSINNKYISDNEIKNVKAGEEVNLNITVSVSKHTDATSDVLTVIVTSDNGKTYMLNITTTIPEQGILESIYDFFESVSESLGLDSILGDYAAPFLIFLFVFVILFLVILVVYLARKKFVEVVCLDRIREIAPDELAEFGIAIHNPSNRRLTYEAYVEIGTKSPGWEVSLDTKSIIIEPKQSHVMTLTVKPTDLVKPNDWIEVKVVVIAVEKQKTSELSTVTSITDEKPDLRITGILHWPKTFKKGDRVTTSFKLENKGKVSAGNITVILYVNNEEKNKVEDITIPSGGYADIEIPWIAVKGKNDVHIVVE